MNMKQRGHCSRHRHDGYVLTMRVLRTPLMKHQPSRSTTYRNPAVRKPGRFSAIITAQIAYVLQVEQNTGARSPTPPTCRVPAESALHPTMYSNMQEARRAAHHKSNSLHPELREAHTTWSRCVPACCIASKQQGAESRGQGAPEESGRGTHSQTGQPSWWCNPHYTAERLQCTRSLPKTGASAALSQASDTVASFRRRRPSGSAVWCSLRASRTLTSDRDKLHRHNYTAPMCYYTTSYTALYQSRGPAFSADTASRKQPIVNLQTRAMLSLTLLWPLNLQGQKLCILLMHAHWTATLLWWNMLVTLTSLSSARTNSCR